jgi:methionine synthase II (cobalamin-independent)
MAKPAPITIPTEPIGSIPRPVDLRHALKIIRKYLKPNQRIFVGVIAPIDPRIETPEEVRDCLFEPGKNWRWCSGDG